MKQSAHELLLMAALLVFCLVATTACMPLFPPPAAPLPRLVGSQVRDLLQCQAGIGRAGNLFVKAQTASVEDCAFDILHLRLLYENELISEEEYEDRLDQIRDNCDKGLRRVERASTRFMDEVIDACDSVGDLILEDYDSLRFQLLAESTDGAVNASSIPALAGSLCGIKSLFALQLIAAQIPRALELYSYLGSSYIVINGENDFEYGFINLRLDDRCFLPDT